MKTENPFQDRPFETLPAAKAPPERGRQSAEISGREAIRLSKQIAAEANAGRSSYTVGMLVVMTIACAAILGVCGTTLQDLMTSQEVRKGLVETILAGCGVGALLGAIAALFVRVSLQTIFLGAMTGGLLGAIVTPSAFYAEQSPTGALIAAAIVGPLLILGVSYAFARLSRRPHSHGQAPQPSSPWEPLPKAKPSPAEEVVEEANEATPVV